MCSFEPRLGGSNPRLGPYFRILTFSTAVFCYIQLASSSAVPEVPWDSHGELIVCIFSSLSQNQLCVHTSANCIYPAIYPRATGRPSSMFSFVASRARNRHTPTPHFRAQTGRWPGPPVCHKRLIIQVGQIHSAVVRCSGQLLCDLPFSADHASNCIETVSVFLPRNYFWVPFKEGHVQSTDGLRADQVWYNVVLEPLDIQLHEDPAFRIGG